MAVTSSNQIAATQPNLSATKPVKIPGQPTPPPNNQTPGSGLGSKSKGLFK